MLPWQYFYDEAGSSLFERICALPEYYLTRTEDAILGAHAGAMVAVGPRAPAMIELGSGSAEKTRRLIAAALEPMAGSTTCRSTSRRPRSWNRRRRSSATSRRSG